VVLAGLTGALWVRADPAARAWVRFQSERPAFTKVVSMVREGRFGDPRDWDYYGPRLPGSLCLISVNCRVARIGGDDGRWVLFIPDWIGIPDDAVGFAHFDAPPDGRFLDGFGSPLCPTTRLGSGWWWMQITPAVERCPPA
jgi:hypothetical protein